MWGVGQNMTIDYSNVGDYSRAWGYAIDNGYEYIIPIIKLAIAMRIAYVYEKTSVNLKR